MVVLLVEYKQLENFSSNGYLQGFVSAFDDELYSLFGRCRVSLSNLGVQRTCWRLRLTNMLEV